MPLRKPALVLLLGLGLGVAFDRLFDADGVGINVPLFVALIVTALAVQMAGEHVRPLRGNIWLFIPLLFFAGAIAVRANSFLSFLNLCAVLAFLAVIAVYFVRQSVAEGGIVPYGLSLLAAPLMALVRGGQASRAVAVQAAASRRTAPRRSWGPAFRGLALALPTVLIFGVLLASADSIFSELLGRLIPDNLADWLQRSLTHGAIVLAVGFFLAGGIAYTVWRGEDAGSSVPQLSLGLRRFLGFTEAIMVIAAVNLLFLAFVIVQVPYLFGGQLNIHMDGFTYAEYARRGFGELVGVSVLVLGLLLLLGEFAHRAEGRQTLIFNVGSTVMVGLTVVMLVSAFKRLLLYEVAYGFTEMRLYPHVFMVWLALLLGWFLVTLWLKPGRFAIGLLLACTGFLVTLNVMNPDGFIVRQNISRALALAVQQSDSYAPRDAEPVDARYLTTLSDDAVPELVTALPSLAPAARKLVEDDLLQRAERLAEERARVSWPGIHVGRRAALAALDLWTNTRQ